MSKHALAQWLPVSLIVLGAALLVLSANWIKIAPPTSYWTDEDIARLEKLNQRVYELFYQLPQEEARMIEARLGNYDGPLTPYEEAVEARNKHRAKRDIAMTRPKQITVALRWSGLAFVAAGALSFYVLRQLAS